MDNTAQRFSFATCANEDHEDILPGTRFPQTSPEMPWKLDFVSERGCISWFQLSLWHSLADHVEVHGKEDIRFTFKNGMEIKV